MKLISQSIKSISRVQKISKYFHGTAISKSLVLHSLGVFLVIFALNLNDTEFQNFVTN